MCGGGNRRPENGRLDKMEAMRLPADLQSLVDQLHAIERTADEIAGRLTEEEFHWQPDGGRRWSVAQCLDHLAVGAEVYMAAMKPAIADARRRALPRQGTAAPGFFGRKFVAYMEPPVTRRGKAPEKILPRPKRTRDEILRAFHDAHGAVRNAVVECADLDTNRATFTNPFLPFIKMRLSTGFNVLTAHGRRHLWQAEQVVRALKGA